MGLSWIARAMVSAAHRLDAPPTHEAARLDLRAHEAAKKLVTELEGWRDLGGEATREEVVSLLGTAIHATHVRPRREFDRARAEILSVCGAAEPVLV